MDKQPDITRRLFQMMALSHRLSMKAYKASSLKALQFVMLNDTLHMLRYDKARLIQWDSHSTELLGISGHPQAHTDKTTNQLYHLWVRHIPAPDKAQELQPSEFASLHTTLDQLKIPSQSTLLWLPIPVKEGPSVALLLEHYHSSDTPPFSDQTRAILQDFVIPSYGAAWDQKTKKGLGGRFLSFLQTKKSSVLLAALILLFVLPVPLRVVAPCILIPEDPRVVTAPVDGIIEQVTVQPGELISEGNTLFEYDKRVPHRRLNIAKKEVDILQSELDRATTLGLTEDPKALQELAIIRLKLEKEKLEYELAQYQASQLTVSSPISGAAVIDDPSEWSGKPVEVGEKVLSVTDPAQTRVRIWIPEKDNIPFDQEKPIKIFLNIDPYNSYTAALTYVAIESSLSPEELPAFLAEAKWNDSPDRAKIGLEGTAVLYGQKVTLFYYLMRKPWAYLRYLIGI